MSVRRRVGVLFRVAQMIDFDAHEAPNDMKLPESLFNVSVFVRMRGWFFFFFLLRSLNALA